MDTLMRRQLLQVGSVGFLGLGLPQLLQANAELFWALSAELSWPWSIAPREPS